MGQPELYTLTFCLKYKPRNDSPKNCHRESQEAIETRLVDDMLQCYRWDPGVEKGHQEISKELQGGKNNWGLYLMIKSQY